MLLLLTPLYVKIYTYINIYPFRVFYELLVDYEISADFTMSNFILEKITLIKFSFNFNQIVLIALSYKIFDKIECNKVEAWACR